jgi:uncharacterized protein
MAGMEVSWLHVTLIPSILAYLYIWRRLLRPLALPRPAYLTILSVLGLLVGSIPVVLLAEYLQLILAPRWELFGLVCWSAIVCTTCCCTMVVDGVRLVTNRVFSNELDAERRLFFQRALSGVAAVAGPAVCAEAFREGSIGPEVTPIEVALDRLPQRMHGFVIAQLSDVHLSPSMRREYIEDVVRKTLSIKPDLIVITGDIADGSCTRLRDLLAPFEDLQAPHGIYAVTGNHEYYCGADEWIEALHGIGIRTLRNERVTIGSPEASFDLAGIDDLSAEYLHPTHRSDLAAALQGRDPQRELVLLAHQPRAIHAAAKSGVGLMLSGHTHGGQIWPMGYVVNLFQPYVKGWARHGDTQIYVSRGTGYGGPPMRLAVPAEITRIELQTNPKLDPQALLQTLRG